MADSPEQHALEYARRNWSLVEGECNGLRADAIAITAFAAGYRAAVEDAARVAAEWQQVRGLIGPLQTIGIQNAANGILAAIRALVAQSAPAPGDAQDQ